jgi:GT2 family glycosyltransferase
MSPDISVIIVNYNGERWLAGCLDAVLRQQGPSFEIVVVDNGSTDRSLNLVPPSDSCVRVVRLPDNRGFAGGNNAGAAAARGRLLAFLNNDTVVEPGWLAALQRPLDRDPAIGMTTSRIVYLHDPSIIDSAGDGWARWGGAFKRGHGSAASAWDASDEVFGACGAAFMIRREIFSEVGGFDEDLFLVHEDVDLSYRVQLLDYRCFYVADARVRHAGSATLGTVSRDAVFQGQRNLEWVYFKNTPAGLLIRSCPGHAVYVAAAALYLARLGLFGTFVRAKWSALAGLPRLLAKRRQVQRARRASSGRLWSLMEPRWLQLKRAEKQFDLRLARSK